MTRLRETGDLLFPGFVAVLGFAPAGLIGPLAFAMRDDFPLPATVLGSSYSIFYIASAVLSSQGTWFLRRLKALTLSRLGLLASSLVCISMAFSWDVASLIAMTIIGGIVNGIATPALNLVVVQTLPARRQGLGFGIRVASIPASATLAMLGAFLVSVGVMSWQGVFIAHGVVGCAVLFFSVANMVRGRDRTIPAAKSPSTSQTREKLSLPLALFLIGGMLGATGTLFYSVFLVDALAEADVSVSVAAALVGIVGWLGIAARVLFGILSDRIGNARVVVWMIIGLLAAAILGMLGLVFGSGLFVFTLGVFAMMCLGWAWPGMIHHSTMVLFARQAALASSQMQTVLYVGTVLGAMLYGFVADLSTYRTAWLPPIVVLVGAIIALIWALRELDKQPTEDTGAPDTKP